MTALSIGDGLRLGDVLPAPLRAASGVTPAYPDGWCTSCQAAACRCPKCHGAGEYRIPAPDGFGLSRVEVCECRRGRATQRAQAGLAAVSVLASLCACTFASFDATVPGLGAAHAAARQFAEVPVGWLVLHGDVGVGKTHLAAAVGHFLVARGEQVVMHVVAEMLRELRRPFSENDSAGYHALFDALRTVPVLILDDYGAEKKSDWAVEQLFTLVDERWRHRRPLVVTSNCLPQLEARVRDRLTDDDLSVVVGPIKAASYRQRPAKYRVIPGGRSEE